jgi:plastocyanin
MRAQDYQPPKLTLGVIGVIAVLIPVLLGYFLVSGLATNRCYEGLCGSTSTSVTTSSGPGAVVRISMPSGAGTGPSAAPGYAPDNVTLVIGVNNSVTWSNDDTVPHTVTSTSVPSGASSFDSGNMVAGAKFTETFTVPGTYQYHCSYHSWMTGTVTVVQSP